VADLLVDYFLFLDYVHKNLRLQNLLDLLGSKLLMLHDLHLLM
jgi:hypothetical protein